MASCQPVFAPAVGERNKADGGAPLSLRIPGNKSAATGVEF
jgi:hypothetical protein